MSLSKTAMKRESKSDPDILMAALEAVHRGMMVRAASLAFGIPKSTIHDLVKQGYVVKKGWGTVLSPELEARIANWISHMARIGYGQTRNDIIEKVH